MVLSQNPYFGPKKVPWLLKELHDIARKYFVAWREAHKPRDPNNPFFLRNDSIQNKI